MSTQEISHPVFASLYDRLMPETWLLAPHREYLAEGLSGRVLDLGAGSGALFPYVRSDAVEDDAVESDRVEYHAVEPDPHMRKRAAATARETGLDVDLRDARAESLPYPDGTFDVVIAGIVFCTIREPGAALDEVARVLKPGGELRFLEHVRADGWTGSVQDAITPVWERAAGGCQLDRRTVERFVGHEAFEPLEIERLDRGLFPATPFVRGKLRRRRGGPF